ncbi:AsmA family protein [Candidatus Omnitrophota bacterium]
MKIIKIIFVSFVVLILIALSAAFIFLKTFDANRFKPQIISFASAALGRAVDFDDISLGLSLTKGLQLTLEQLSIGDSVGFQKGSFLTVEGISLGVEIIPLLSKKQVIVSSIYISSPECIIIRDKDGQLNVQDLAKPRDVGSLQDQKAVLVTPAVVCLPLINAEAIIIESGKFTYIDRALDPGLSLDISGLRLEINGFSLRKPFSFLLEGSVFSKQNNVRVEGRIDLNLKTNKITISDVEIVTDLSALSLSQLQSSLAMLESAELPQEIRGKINLDIKEMELGTQDLSSLAIKGELTKGLIRYKQLALPLEPISSEFEITESKIEIKELLIGLDKGRIALEAQLNDYASAQDFNLQLDVQYLDLAKMLSRKGAPLRVEGFVVGSFTAEGQGFSPPNLRDYLSGEGKLEIKQGRLMDINVLKIVLSKISIIPNLVETIQSNLPERYKDKLTQKDTVITKAETSISVANAEVLLKQVEVEADGFIFSGRGKVNFNQKFSIVGSFFIPADLAASMARSVPELEYLLEETGDIRIPLQVSGKPPEIKFSVDLEYIGKKILKKKATEEIGNALNKIFQRESPEPAPKEDSGTTDTSATDTPPEQQKAPEQEIIENVLDLIFR